MKKIKNLGIPYMGSKRKLAPKIIDYILEQNPNVKYFYDLFGGGGAMSFEALQREQIKEVHYNELNTGVVALLNKIRNDGITKEFYEWVDRETFKEYKAKDCWRAGLIKTCWSFGNSQRAYLFSRENEFIKRLLHEIIVNKCENSIEDFDLFTNILIDKSLLVSDSINERRLTVMAFVKKFGRIDLERLQQLEQLQQLQQLEQLERLQQLEITNLSFDEVEITTPINETIIYLDPPYFNTAKYAENLCHNKLNDYIKNSSYKTYMSSYESDLFECCSFEHRSTLSATANNKVIEKLFCNHDPLFD